MNTEEKQVLVKLLRLASDHFSNFSCNDFNLEKFIPGKHARIQFVREVIKWSGVFRGDTDDDSCADPCALQDWMLMDYFADQLEGETALCNCPNGSCPRCCPR